MATMIEMVRRDEVLAILKDHPELHEAVRRLFCFPAPNPEQRDGRNIMGQTEDEFWALLDRA